MRSADDRTRHVHPGTWEVPDLDTEMSEIGVEDGISRGYPGLGGPGIDVAAGKDSEGCIATVQNLIKFKVRRHPFLLNIYLITARLPGIGIRSTRRFLVPSWQGASDHLSGRGVPPYTPATSVRGTGCNRPSEWDYVICACPPNRSARSSPSQCCIPSLFSRTAATEWYWRHCYR